MVLGMAQLSSHFIVGSSLREQGGTVRTKRMQLENCCCCCYNELGLGHEHAGTHQFAAGTACFLEMLCCGHWPFCPKVFLNDTEENKTL